VFWKPWADEFMREFGSVEEKMQTWGHAAPIPPAQRRRTLRGGRVFVGGETGSHSRRAAGFAPNAPHFLGKARPLLEFGIEDFSTEIAVFGESEWSSCRITTRQKKEKFEDSIADFADEERSCISNLRNL
jgi:hypothetical protein